MTKNQLDIFEKLKAQLEGLYIEISTLSKKAQNDPLNKFKLKLVNQILEGSNKLLGSTYKPFYDFDLFIDDDLPTTSDIAMILTQYLGCFEKLKSDNVIEEYGHWYWVIDKKKSDILTTRPKK